MRTRLIHILTILTILWATATPSQAQPGLDTNFDTDFDDNPVTVSVTATTTTVEPGGTLVLAVTFDHADGFHIYPNIPIIPDELGDFPAIATTITLTLPDQTPPPIQAGQIQWPEPYISVVRFLGPPVDLLTYAGKATAYIPIQIHPDAPLGDHTIDIAAYYQACDDTTCFAPTRDTRSITLTITNTPEPILPNPLFSNFDPSTFSNPDTFDGSTGTAATEPLTNQRKFLGLIVLPPINSPAGIAAIALAAAFGGFILNLTPCVLPVIPLKIMTITSHAGESKSRAILLGTSMAIGVVAFWVGIGIPVAFVADFVDPSIIFGLWQVTLVIGLLIAIMGLGIMGLFTIKLPQSTYRFTPKADSPTGSFMFGIMTAVLGLPCFGFVAGALLAGAATMQPWQVMIIFFSLGIGMAFPYLILTLNPKWMNKIPKTGPASELVKQVMGLLMLAAATYFLGVTMISIASGQGWATPWWFKTIHWWIIALFALTTGTLLLIRTLKITKKLAPRTIFSFLGLLIATSGIAIAANQTTHQYHDFWQPYSESALTEAIDSGKVVVLDFTAEWCLNCKALEAKVLNRDPVKSLLLSPAVIPMSADLTAMSALGWDKLKALGQTGIPLLVIYEPGNPEPVWLSNAYTSDQVVAAITQALGQ